MRTFHTITLKRLEEHSYLPMEPGCLMEEQGYMPEEHSYVLQGHSYMHVNDASYVAGLTQMPII